MKCKKIKTMAEKLEEKSIVRPDAIASLFRVKALIAGDIPGKISKAVYDAQQAQSVGDLNSLEENLTDIEDLLYSAERQVRSVRHKILVKKIDMLPKPAGCDTYEEE